MGFFLLILRLFNIFSFGQKLAQKRIVVVILRSFWFFDAPNTPGSNLNNLSSKNPSVLTQKGICYIILLFQPSDSMIRIGKQQQTQLNFEYGFLMKKVP